ncbi:MAG: arsenite methyltransferase [Candidatus Binataceae bacterium]
MNEHEGLKEDVRRNYAQAALRVRAQSGAAGAGKTSCCGADASCGDPITANLYSEAERAGLPPDAVAASLGCGNPTALAELKPGETVLDLGAGGGIDVLLSARRVGPEGKAYGLDMTDEMLALARENQRKADVSNVEFLKGEIERVPLPGASVDVIISNCVINLSGEKERVLREAMRVLKAGGRFAVSDIVIRGELAPELRARLESLESWVGCIAGALTETEYRAKLAAVGFEAIEVEPTRVYTADDVAGFLASAKLDAGLAAPLEGKFMSAFVRARKPL